MRVTDLQYIMEHGIPIGYTAYYKTVNDHGRIISVFEGGSRQLLVVQRNNDKSLHFLPRKTIVYLEKLS
jgi:ribosomal 30S subunit maturation factor RimM